jgi:hypothetical protein
MSLCLGASKFSSIDCRPHYETVMAGRATLMIAHRLAAGKEADTTSCWTRGPSSSAAGTKLCCSRLGYMRVWLRCARLTRQAQ